jgi:hypothetical protein|tara:strand:+ start:2886 stop:3140 length:255 start_codon:yes stop_codon:yes gene_type:complete
MTILTTFILVGMIDSHDAHFATVELNTTPASNGGPALAVIPVSAFPCEIYEGKVFYVVKLHDEQDAAIVCQKEPQDEPRRGKID